MRCIHRIPLLTAALAALLAAGCSHTQLKRSPQQTRGIPASLTADFEYVRLAAAPCRGSVLETKSKYTVRRVELGVPDGATNRWIEFDYYNLHQSNRAPVVMVLPMMGGSYWLERHFANYFAGRGYASVIVRRDRRARKARLEDINRLMKDMVIDHRRVIDWIETQPGLDANQIAIFGISMGGIKGALLLPLEPRIKAAALGLAGCDLPYIVARSTEPGIVKRRERELAERNLTLEEAERELRDAIQYDPVHYAAYVDPGKVLLVLARYDRTVPIEKGLELKERMGHPETIMLPANHYTAILGIPYIKSQAFDFFAERFAASSPTLAKRKAPPALRGKLQSQKRDTD